MIPWLAMSCSGNGSRSTSLFRRLWLLSLGGSRGLVRSCCCCCCWRWRRLLRRWLLWAVDFAGFARCLLLPPAVDARSRVFRYAIAAWDIYIYRYGSVHRKAAAAVNKGGIEKGSATHRGKSFNTNDTQYFVFVMLYTRSYEAVLHFSTQPEPLEAGA